MSRNDSELGNFKTGVADARAEPTIPDTRGFRVVR